MRFAIAASVFALATGVIAGDCPTYGTWRPNTRPDGYCTWDFCQENLWWWNNRVDCGYRGCATTYRGSCKGD
jgi:hypothetical protein